MLAPVVLSVILATGASACKRADPQPRTHTVSIAAMRFEPAVLTVAAGDTIVWANNDLFPHTATSKDAGFDSDMIQSTQSWRHTLRTRGTFPYVCRYHPTMAGTVRVE